MTGHSSRSSYKLESLKKKPLAFYVYIGALWIMTPFLYLLLFIRKYQGKEHITRLSEKRGLASLPTKPNVIWCHAASVGEYNALKILLLKWTAEFPHLTFLVTTITITSAEIAQKDIDQGAKWQHQFAPLDHPLFINRFLNHWKPSLFLSMESEIWPYTLHSLKKRQVACLLVNARMSKTSARHWGWFRKTAQWVLSHFDIICVQNQDYHTRFQSLSNNHPNIIQTGNIKCDAEPLITKNDIISKFQPSLQSRKILPLISSHSGEEEIFIEHYIRLKTNHPDLLLVLCPRHAIRGGELALLIQHHGLSLKSRSQNELPLPETDVYIWDSMGELGSIYALFDWTFIGGSFIKHGGQNPMEAIQKKCFPFHGPHVFNFKDIYQDLGKAGGSKNVTVENLYLEIENTLSLNNSLDYFEKLIDKGIKTINEHKGALTHTHLCVLPYLKILK